MSSSSDWDHHVKIKVPPGFTVEVRNGKLSMVPTPEKNETSPTYDQCLYPTPDYISNLTDEQINEAIELEFSATGEWPGTDQGTFRAVLKHFPTVLRLHHEQELKTDSPSSSARRNDHGH